MIAIGCDHAAFDFKNKIIEHLKAQNISVEDFGSYNTNSVDYPDIALKLAKAVAAKQFESGILICGTGIGMSMAANKIKGIRCAVCGDTFSARATREHNDANILALGERVIGIGLALDIVDTFIKTKFSNDERHNRRIDKISQIENL